MSTGAGLDLDGTIRIVELPLRGRGVESVSARTRRPGSLGLKWVRGGIVSIPIEKGMGVRV